VVTGLAPVGRQDREQDAGYHERRRQARGHLGKHGRRTTAGQKARHPAAAATTATAANTEAAAFTSLEQHHADQGDREQYVNDEYDIGHRIGAFFVFAANALSKFPHTGRDPRRGHGHCGPAAI
jgi:hypothetical protein